VHLENGEAVLVTTLSHRNWYHGNKQENEPGRMRMYGKYKIVSID
jgi:hypothetical protein